MSADLTGTSPTPSPDTVVAVDVEPAELLDRGLRPRERYRPSQPNEFRTPALPTPRPERPSSWPQTACSREEILSALDVLELDVSVKERGRRRLGMTLLLD